MTTFPRTRFSQDATTRQADSPAARRARYRRSPAPARMRPILGLAGGKARAYKTPDALIPAWPLQGQAHPMTRSQACANARAASSSSLPRSHRPPPARARPRTGAWGSMTGSPSRCAFPCVCLREPALGPCFGMKGGAAWRRTGTIAADGGYQHCTFNGDFHAVILLRTICSRAMLEKPSALGQRPRHCVRRITGSAVIDMERPRALRNITIGLGGPAHGVPREDGFRHHRCLGSDGDPLPCRRSRRRCNAGSVPSSSAIAATRPPSPPVISRCRWFEWPCCYAMRSSPTSSRVSSHAPAFVHGGPFGNIAHGCLFRDRHPRVGFGARRYRRHGSRIRR